jgi:hypothetical protein
VRIRILALLLALPLIAGCVGQPVTADPGGVDGLELPTPTPDPADFVAVVDNPWLAYEPGSRWEYEGTRFGSPVTSRVEVLVDAVTVAGVPTTPVRTLLVAEDGETLEDSTAWFAQDVDGNVWALGREVRTGELQPWRAGQDGAEAGLAMPDAPRRGDGWAEWYRDGEPQGRVEVASTDADPPADVVIDADRPLLLLERSTASATTRDDLYRAGTGLVVVDAGSPLELRLSDVG